MKILSEEREKLSVMLRTIGLKVGMCDVIMSRVVEADRDFIKRLKYNLFSCGKFDWGEVDGKRAEEIIDKLAGPELIDANTTDQE